MNEKQENVAPAAGNTLVLTNQAANDKSPYVSLSYPNLSPRWSLWEIAFPMSLSNASPLKILIRLILTFWQVRAHQSNPVAWQPWNEKTIQLAKKHDRLIFLSIGYSACHCTPQPLGNPSVRFVQTNTEKGAMLWNASLSKTPKSPMN